MPTTTQIEYLLAVAQHRHFGRAAEHCHVSQPSLSMQIQKLEEELGLIIFNRNKKPIEVTPQGEMVVEQAKKMMNEYHRLLQISRSETAEVKGELRLGVIPTLATSLLPLMVKTFSDQYPKVDLRISELTTESLLEKIKYDEVDVGLLVTPIPQANLETHVLFYEEFFVYCSPGHPLLEKSSLRLSDINKRTDLWLLSDGHCFKNQVLNFCGVTRERQVFPNVHFQSGNLETLMELIRRGQGFTFLPELHVRRLSSQDKKQIRSFQSPVPSREVSLVYPKGLWKGDLLQALTKTFDQVLPEDLPRKATRSINILDISS